MTHLPHTRDDVSSVRRTWLAAGLLALHLVLCTPPVWAQPRPVLHYNSEITLTATPQRARAGQHRGTGQTLRRASRPRPRDALI